MSCSLEEESFEGYHRTSNSGGVGETSDLRSLWWIVEVQQTSGNDICDLFRLTKIEGKHDLASKAITEIVKIITWFLTQETIIPADEFQQWLLLLENINLG
jgi:hypothetical protein